MRRWRYEPAADHGLAPLDKLRSPRRENGLAEAVLHQACAATIRLVLRAREHLQVVGRDRLPPGPPFVLVSNHCSHLDAPSLAAVVPWHAQDLVYPIAAGDTFFENAAATSIVTLLLNALPIRRGRCGRRAMLHMRRRLVDEPCAYVLFPEGTRSRSGDMGRFRPGIGMLVAGLDVPVVPCHLRGTFDAWPPDRPLPAAGHVEVRIGTPQTFETTRDDRGGWESVAQRLEHAVRDLGRT